jgi:hypothetical protein
MTTRCLDRTLPLVLLAASFAAGGAGNQGPISPLQGISESSLPVNLAGQPFDPFADPHAKVWVFVFVRVDCPISNRYAPEVRRLFQEFASPSVPFYLVYVDPGESSDEIRAHMRDYGYPIMASRDNKHALVKMTGVKVTPEAAVFVPGPSGVRMVYRGRIDDQYVDFGKTRPAPTTHDLEEVLQAIVQGRTVATQTTRAVGCFIQDLK